MFYINTSVQWVLKCMNIFTNFFAVPGEWITILLLLLFFYLGLFSLRRTSPSMLAAISAWSSLAVISCARLFIQAQLTLESL